MSVRGKPADGAPVSAQPPYYLGVDLGGTNIKAGVVDDSGQPLSFAKILTEAARGPKVGVERICQAARMAVEKAAIDWNEVQAVGLGSPGTMDLPAGMLLFPHNLPGWIDVPIRQMVADALKKPAVLQNDANAAAFGEYWAGAGRHASSLVLFTLGTGIGCGIVVDDHVIQGQHSHGAECGHMVIEITGARRCPCGRLGCLEAYASATALVKRAHEALEAGRTSTLAALLARNEELTAREVADAAAAGDALAEDLVLETARYLAVGVVNLMHTIDPDIVALGGAMTFGRDETPLGRRFLEEVRAEVRRRAFPVPAEKTEIAYATLGSDAGFIGAAGCARLAARGSAS
jgi:glucokinase